MLHTKFTCGALVALLSPALQADIVWTGAASNDIFDEANWDLSMSSVTVVDPNVSVNDNVLIANTAQPVEIPDLGGQIRFEVGDGYTFTLDNASIVELGNDGVGGAAGTTVGPRVQVINGSQFSSFFITNRTDLDVGPLCTATFGGGATPINGSTVNLTSAATLVFTDETVAAYIAEHLTKTTVDGLPAGVGINILVVSDGGAGCIITVIPQIPASCVGTPGNCPCGNGNDGSNGAAGCANSASSGGAALIAAGSTSITVGDMTLVGSGLVPSSLVVFFQGDITLNSGAGIIFGDGLRCAGNGLIRLQTLMADGNGNSNTSVHIPFSGSVSAGLTRTYQLWYADSSQSPCGSGFNVTNALEVTWVL